YTFRMKVHYGFTPHWIGELIRYPAFCSAVASVWSEVYPARLAEIYDYIDRTVLPLSEAWQKDCLRWGDDPTQTAALRAERIKKSLRGNIEWFNSHIPTP
ncbi:MAG: spore coat protein CotH, partial [Muribaculaceae bacterium]|nr:spore coat protein CotH [Muribaculaceae bacterium]